VIAASITLFLFQNQLFDSFYCLFSNTERAFRTYKTFDGHDDRLLMPDGGYIRLSELEKFYQNNSLVRGDPQQVAKIFESAMHYMVGGGVWAIMLFRSPNPIDSRNQV